jgi:hypothetical protein
VAVWGKRLVFGWLGKERKVARRVTGSQILGDMSPACRLWPGIMPIYHRAKPPFKIHRASWPDALDEHDSLPEKQAVDGTVK